MLEHIDLQIGLIHSPNKLNQDLTLADRLKEQQNCLDTLHIFTHLRT